VVGLEVVVVAEKTRKSFSYDSDSTSGSLRVVVEVVEVVVVAERYKSLG
jgi:hypothetical protein